MKPIPVLLLVWFLFAGMECFSCTIFYFVRDGNMYFCNNEDWSDPDTEIRFYPANRGNYAWVYLGFSNDWAQGGVNEKGLCWDWVAGARNDEWKPDESKKTFRGNLSEEMAKTCATVEEAIAFITRYNEDSFSYARMMIGDGKGESAILGWKNGGMDVQRNKGGLQAFGYRGQIVKECFASGPPDKDLGFIAETLNMAHQEGKFPTRYSNIISITEGKIYLFQSHNYTEYLEIDYLLRMNMTYGKYKINELFAHPGSCPAVKLVLSP